MKRFLLLLVLSVVALAAGLPWWVGGQAEEQYQTYREQIGTEAPFEAVSHEYRRGWLRSHAETVLGVRAEARSTGAPFLPSRIVVRDEIEHGPIPWSSLRRGELGQPVLARMRTELRAVWQEGAEAEAESLSLEAETIVGFDGRARGQLVSRPFEGRLGADLQVAWEGMQGQWHYEPAAERAVGTFGAPGLTLRSEEDTISVRGLEFDFDYHDDPDGIPLGQTRVAVAELSSPPDPGAAPFLARGLELIQFLEVEGQDANAAVSASWESFESEGGIQEGGYVQIAVSHLDSPTLARLLTALEAMERAEDAEAEAAAPVMMLLPDLIERAVLEVQVELADEAALQASASLEGSADAGPPLATLAQLAVDLELSAAAAFAEEKIAAVLASRAETPGAKLEASPRARELLRQLETRDLIVSDGGRYATHVRYRQLQLEVNGHAIDPQSLSDLGESPAAAEALPPHMPMPGPVTTWPAAPAP